MATLHLICGLPCAGKTTLERQLEQDYAALRLTPDEWHTLYRIPASSASKNTTKRGYVSKRRYVI